MADLRGYSSEVWRNSKFAADISKSFAEAYDATKTDFRKLYDPFNLARAFRSKRRSILTRQRYG